jgi:hypothetical protein
MNFKNNHFFKFTYGVILNWSSWRKNAIITSLWTLTFNEVMFDNVFDKVIFNEVIKWHFQLCVIKRLSFFFPENSNFVDETNQYNLRNNHSFDDNQLVTSPTSSASYVVSETPTYQSIFANTLTTHTKTQQSSDTCSNNSSMSNAA